MSNAYPLILEPILKPKVWGGRRLAECGKQLPPDQPTGESWELADLGSTSASGGGGDSAHSVISNGALAGKTIAINEPSAQTKFGTGEGRGHAVVGPAPAARRGRSRRTTSTDRCPTTT